MAAIAVRRLRTPCLGYFDDPGKLATESTIQDSLVASAAPNEILGFGLKISKAQWGTQLEFLGVAARFVIVEGVGQAHSSLSPDRVQKLIDEIPKILQRKKAFLSLIQNLLRKLNFARPSGMGRVGEWLRAHCAIW